MLNNPTFKKIYISWKFIKKTELFRFSNTQIITLGIDLFNEFGRFVDKTSLNNKRN